MTRRTSLIAALLLGACAKGVSEFGDGTTPTTATGGGGGQGGSGGAGGGKGGAGGSFGPCPVDCSKIKTPACSAAHCNDKTLQCEVTPAKDGSPCEDGQFCTIHDSCMAGACVGGENNSCAMTALPCNEIACDEASKTCTNQPANDGTSCTPDDLCQTGGACLGGSCYGSPKDCTFAPMPDECHIGVCNPKTGDCDPTPGNEGKACVDSNDLCSKGKTCVSGVCSGGTPLDCGGLTKGCKNGVCDKSSGVCVQELIPAGGKCLEATNDCNDGICDAMGKCNAKPVNEGGKCEDGNLCTSGEKCTAGVCSGGMPVAPMVYFADGFADNSKGWQLGPEWQIGAAKASSGQEYGSPDPASDFTPSADNGVAGVVIGGNITVGQHAAYYLTSPVIDTSNVNGPLWLGYRRWLNSDYAPYMINTVEVYDGNGWVTLFKSGASPGIKDAAWTLFIHDVTKYKNKSMQIRFGHSVGQSGAYVVSGWNLDDVTLASAVCSN